MKKTIQSLLFGAVATIACLGNADAAVTINFANYTGSGNGPNGIPVVDAAGACILNSSNSLYFSLGYLTAGGDNTASSVLARFNPIDLVPQVPSVLSQGNPRNSLVNGTDFSNATNALPSGFSGMNAVVMIGNNVEISKSTAIAMFNLGTAFGTPDPVAGLVQNFALTSASVPVVGTLRSVTTQPLAQTNTFAQGVMLAPIPETSTALLGALGALGLLRRRR